jgi:hypothetical protein
MYAKLSLGATKSETVKYCFLKIISPKESLPYKMYEYDPSTNYG